MAKVNIYELVTNRIIEQLKNDIIPWKKPWRHINAYNIITKKPYSMLNQMLLSRAGAYATFKQWTELGGRIKKNAKSEIIVFYKTLHVKKRLDDEDENNDINDTISNDDDCKIINIPFWRYIRVFHSSQVDNIQITEDIIETPIDVNIEVEDVISNYIERENLNFEVVTCNKAFYDIKNDRVTVPSKEQYMNINLYYNTIFHELVHSTGNKKRLNRFNRKHPAKFGSKVYSKEELVAEIGSAYILNLLDIEIDDTFNNSVAYIKSWLKVLMDDNKCIIPATIKAEKAVDYIFTGIK